MHMLWPIVGFCVPVDHRVACFSPLRRGGGGGGEGRGGKGGDAAVNGGIHCALCVVGGTAVFAYVNVSAERGSYVV